nr:MAG TPA: hypothetical protein [Caudoviricetes sp.]
MRAIVARPTPATSPNSSWDMPTDSRTSRKRSPRRNSGTQPWECIEVVMCLIMPVTCLMSQMNHVK